MTFINVYVLTYDEQILPEMSKGPINIEALIDEQHFTQPPPRYSEASLVKKLEELGIGRPSTYAPTISTIQNRGYIEKGSVEGVERKYEQLTLKADKIIEQN